jgi:biotin carboxyl carrier protein
MILEAITLDNKKSIDLISKSGNEFTIKVGEKIYILNVASTGSGIYSILHDGKSYEMDVIPGDGPKKFIVNSKSISYEVEIEDNESRYLKNKNKGLDTDSSNILYAPMPGKVVNVLVNEGDEVIKGQPMIIISAMKMESEFKAGKDGLVKEIKVNAGETVNGGQILIVIG